MRSQRPIGSSEPCPFCPGREQETPPERLAWGRSGHLPANGPGWTLRVVPNRYPALHPAGARTGDSGVLPATGVHEVVIESADHGEHPADRSVPDWRTVLAAWRDRVRAIREEPSVVSVVVFRNQGAAAGASLPHPHSQIVGLPVRIPSHAVADPDRCPVCRLTQDESGRVFLDDAVAVGCPQASRFAYETWIVPGTHGVLFDEAPDALLESTARRLRDTLGGLRDLLGDRPFNLVLHPGEPGPGAHWSLEVLPKTAEVGGFEKGTGIWINETLPEDAAGRLRAQARFR